MRRFALSMSFAALISVSVANAASVGIPVCDDFLTKYEACATGKIPAAQQAAFKAQLDQLRASWTAAAQNPSARPALETACKQTLEQMKVSLAAYSCGF